MGRSTGLARLSKEKYRHGFEARHVADLPRHRPSVRSLKLVPLGADEVVRVRERFSLLEPDGMQHPIAIEPMVPANGVKLGVRAVAEIYTCMFGGIRRLHQTQRV